MNYSFSTILVPVDFSSSTDVAIQKALWLADPGGAVIHLLHVMGITSQASGFLMHGFAMISSNSNLFFKARVQRQLDDISYAIKKAHPRVKIITHIANGDMIQKQIIQYANVVKPALIIIGKNRNHDWFSLLKMVNASAVSSHTNCPVLTVKPGSVPNRLKTIVIPVSSFVPLRKIDLLTPLTRNHRPLIHLVAVDGNEEFGERPGIFLETYRTISEQLHYPVIYNIVKGKNAGKSILQYAKSIEADLIMVNPNEESSVNPVLGLQINDMISPGSTTCVLTAKPYLKNNLKIIERSIYEKNM